ncbi:MAG: tetratricopeptide repeat protein [Myxococcota bacterium]
MIRNRFVALVIAAGAGPGCGPAKQAPPPLDLIADPPPTADGTAPGAGQTELDRGIGYVEEEEWQLAITELERAMKFRPRDGQAKALWALSKYRLGELEAAEKAFEASLKLDGAPLNARAYLAEIYLAKEPPLAKEAIAILEPVAKAEPHALDIHELLAFSYSQVGDYDNSTKHYDLVLAKNDTKEIRMQYADMLFRAGRGPEADEQMRRLLPAYNDDLKIVAAFAHRFAKVKSWDDCISTFTRAAELKPKEPSFYVHRGICRHEKGEESLAQSDYRRALDQDSRYQPAFYYTGMSYLVLNRPGPAAKAFETAIKIDRNSPVGKAALKQLEKIANPKKK